MAGSGFVSTLILTLSLMRKDADGPCAPPFLLERSETVFGSPTGREDWASSVAFALVIEAVEVLAVTADVVVTFPTLPVREPSPSVVPEPPDMPPRLTANTPMKPVKEPTN